MHAFLLIGSTSDKRTDEIQRLLLADAISVFDTVTILPNQDKEHIGIAEIRAYNSQLQLSPRQSPYMAGIIQKAHLMTVESQNALLKLLEEPPPRVKIYMESENADSLLPTIRSRCQTIRIENAKSEAADLKIYKDMILTLLGESNGNKLKRIAAIADDRIHAREWTLEAQKSVHEMLLDSLAGKSTGISIQLCVLLLRRLRGAALELSINVNPKLVMDMVFLSV